MPYSITPSSSPSSSGSKKKKHGWLIPFPTSREDLLTPFQGPFSYLLERTPWGPSQAAGTALGGLGTSPAATLLFPGSSVRNAQTAVTGIWEGPYGFGKSVKDIGFGDTASLFWHGMVDDYKSRYGNDWRKHARENPLFNLFDALTVLGTGARGAALLGAGERLGESGARITARNLWKESSRPGLISEGEARTRRISYTDTVGKEQSINQPLSRSPLRRFTQESFSDPLAERFPNAPIFGARSRVARGEGSQVRRIIERTFGKVVGEEALNGLGTAGRSRLYWEAQLGVESGDNAALTKLRNALEREYDADPSDVDPEFAQILREAKQAGFGKGVLLKRLDDAIAFDPTSGKNKRRYDAARDALRQATVLSERTIADSEGFSSLQTDLKRVRDHKAMLEEGTEEWANADALEARLSEELSQKAAGLETMFRNRRSIVRDWLDAQGDHEHSRAWKEALASILGEDQANQSIALAHALANKIRPENPESWWADKVGMPGREGAAAFRERVGEDALFQFGDERGLLDSGFYSPTQQWVTEEMKGPMQVGQLRSELNKAGVPDQEIYNAGLDMYFEALGDNAVVTPQEFQALLTHRLNAYNLRQIVRTNTPDSPHEALYDIEHQGNYVSRDPGPGEYYEVQFELPGGGRDQATFMDRNRHWGRQNVVAHFRFHVFEEDGKRKLLIEEIQSDWASEWRQQVKEGKQYRDLKPDEQEAFDHLRSQIEEVQAQRVALRDNPEADPVVLADLRDREHELGRMFDFYNDEFGLGAIPPSPLGTGTGAKSSYINSPIRWIGRYAVENDVDEVIVISREAQLARNAKAVDPRDWHSHLAGGDAQAVTQHIRANMPESRSFIGYAEDIPKRAAQEWGVAGKFVDDAYEGAYRIPIDFEQQAPGRMPGTVFTVNDAFREAAMRPKSMYQRTPDWDALPKGAVELFDGGKSRIHIFENGDVSTWIHELGHVAIHDLSAEDQGVLASHFAGGKAIEKWTEMEHEDFARSFEQYVREGRAPTRVLEPVFAKLSAWIRAVWEREKRVNPDLPAGVRDVFSSLFRSQNEPDIFIPHRPGAPDLGGGRTSRGIPRANRELGDRTMSRIPIFAKNQLGLMRSGLLHDDPRTLMEHANRVVALARANALREHVLAMGEPLLPGEYPDFQTQYVVKRAGRGVDKPTFDALESADNPQEIRDTIRDYIDEHITDEKHKYESWVGESQLYVVDKKSVDMLFKYVTGKTPGAATKPTTNTAKVIDAGLDSIRGLLLYANPGFYITNLLGNSGMAILKDPRTLQYLPHSMNEAMKSAIRPESADPQWQRITVEMGRGPTSGSFSLQSVGDVLTGKPGEQGNLAGRAGEKWSAALGEWGRRSGRVIDDSFRVAAWKQSAAKLGYDSKAEINKLFDDASIEHPFKGKITEQASKAQKDLAAIRDEAEQLMLDFDSMSPFERQYLQRIIFLYPFLKASTKYPVMFAGERPITSGLLFGAGGQGQKFAEQEGVLGPRPDLPQWLAGYARGPGGFVNVGSFSPFNMPPQLIESLMHIRGPGEVGVQRPLDYLNPAVQTLLDMARQQNAYGREAPIESILRQEFPAPAYLAYPLRKPSTRWKERDFWNTLLRSLRIAPVGVNEGETPSG